MLIGDLQDDAGKSNEAIKAYASIIPLLASTTTISRSTPEYRNWTEQLLARYAILMHRSMQLKNSVMQWKVHTNETLAPFRAWANLPWADTSRTGNVGQSEMATKSGSTSRRRIWQLYYNALSTIMQQELPYPAIGHGPSTSAQEMSTDNVMAVENIKLQQSIELRRVEGIYEEILLKEVPFPKASEASAEVESWIDQVMANWRVVSGSSWQNGDLGKGGKEAMTRNVLAVGRTGPLFYFSRIVCTPLAPG